jgi:MscS family membrane protein
MEKITAITEGLKNIEISSYINLLIAMIVIIFFLIFSSTISYHIIKIFYQDKGKTKKEKQENKEKIKKSSIYKALVTLLVVIGIYLGTKIMDLTTAQSLFVDKIFKIFMMWFIATAICAIFESREQILDKTNLPIDIKRNSIVMNFLGKILKIILYTIAAYLSLKEFNYDLGGIATGIGIGSAVLALAMQDLVKGTFAGIILFLDRPFEIGDWIEVDGKAGTVEDLTLRSTKIRTAKDTIITIQNDTIITKSITNSGKIKKRVYESNINLPLETKEIVVEKITNRIRFILKYNKDIIPESVKVTLNTIKETGINIYIWADTKITNYGEYMEFCHKTNLTIMNILESQGVKLAYPGTNVYIKENKLVEEPKSKKEKTNLKTKK